MDEQLKCCQEADNDEQLFAVALFKEDHTGHIIPTEIARLCRYFLEHDGEIITGSKKWSGAWWLRGGYRISGLVGLCTPLSRLFN